MIFRPNKAAYVITVTLLLLMVTGVEAEPGSVVRSETILLTESKFLGPNKNQDSVGVMGEHNEALSPVEPAIHALRLAADKARELGYDLNKHLIKLTQKKEGGWEIYFHPMQEKKGTRGGGVTMHIDEIGTVSRIQRWR